MIKSNDFYTSDHHFFHEAICDMCQRPFGSVKEMNQALIDRWNEIVKPTDRVFVIGDFCMGPKGGASTILCQLNGHKVLILGNHDRSRTQMLESGFNEVHRILEQVIAGQKVLLHHYPYAPKPEDVNMELKDKLKYLNKRPKKIAGQFLLHGHSHKKSKVSEDGFMIHVGVDAWDYRPVPLEAIEDIINKKTK